MKPILIKIGEKDLEFIDKMAQKDRRSRSALLRIGGIKEAQKIKKRKEVIDYGEYKSRID